MAFTPIPLGQNHVLLSLTWKDDGGNAIDLTGATVTCRIAPINGTGSSGAGAVTVTNATAGTLTYKFASSEVATTGTYEIQFKAVFGDGTILYSDALFFQVVAVI